MSCVIISLLEVMDGGHTVAENTISSWWEEPRGGEQCHLPGELILFSKDGGKRKVIQYKGGKRQKLRFAI